MNKVKIGISLFVIGSLISGCSHSNIKVNKETIEYGEDISKVQLFSYKDESDVVKSSMNIDTKEVGIYSLTVSADKESIEQEMKVIDSVFPEIELHQSKEKVFQIPFHADYDYKGNIKKVSDPIDGEINTFHVVDLGEYEKIKSQVENDKKEIHSRVFKSDEEVKNGKEKQRENNLCVFVASELNTEKEGEYEVKILAVDYNFNTSEVAYKVKVVKENVSDEQLAKGAIKQSQTDSKSQKSTSSSCVIDKVESPKSVKSTNAVVKAALARVGQSLWCDELCSHALVDAGVLTGDSSHFPGGMLALSCYQSIGKSISKSQLKPGDILYYNNAGSGKKHVAVYVGDNKAVHGGFQGKVVLGRVNVGDGPSQYLRMPDHFTWDEASKMVFGFTLSEANEGNVSNPGGQNQNIDVYTNRTLTKNNEFFNIDGKNIDVDALDFTISQYQNDKIKRDTFINKVKSLGCTISIEQLEPVPVPNENQNSSSNSNNNQETEVKVTHEVTRNGKTYNITGINVDEDTLDATVYKFLCDEIDENTFISQVKSLGCTITIN